MVVNTFLLSVGFMTSMLSNERVSELQLLGAVLFFGSSIAFQREAMVNGIGPYTYQACRYVVSIAGTLLFKSDLLCNSNVPSMVDVKAQSSDEQRRNLLFYGFIGGICQFSGCILQQIGLVTVSASRGGFITGMYVVFVPVAEWFLAFLSTLTCCYYCVQWCTSSESVVSAVLPTNTAITLTTWLAVVASFLGLYLLSGCWEVGYKSDEQGEGHCLGNALGVGDLLVFLGMFFWVASIMISDVACKVCPILDLVLLEFSMVLLLSTVAAVVLEPAMWHLPLSEIRTNWLPIVIVGLFEAAAFILGCLGQMYTSSTRAALLYSLESVVAAVTGALLLGESLTAVEMLGCLLMFGAASVSSVSGVRINVTLYCTIPHYIALYCTIPVYETTRCRSASVCSPT